MSFLFVFKGRFGSPANEKRFVTSTISISSIHKGLEPFQPAQAVGTREFGRDLLEGRIHRDFAMNKTSI